VWYEISSYHKPFPPGHRCNDAGVPLPL
jgi:hypothetical protein